LMPSVAGVAIVKWICLQGGDKLLSLLYLPSGTEQLDTASLILLFLYGNLFCYVASYPILVFHATRVLDFSEDKWTKVFPTDGYVATGLLALVSFLVTLIPHQDCREWAAFGFALVFMAIQFRRVWKAFSTRIAVKGCKGFDGTTGGKVTAVYGYAFTLSTRRAKPTKSTETVNQDFEDDERLVTNRGEALWHKDYMETYRHLREHGNSAFIFILELVLAALSYCVVKPERTAFQQLSAIGILFAIWALPAVSVHLTGQYLERRFSHYDRRI